jgi:diacylglycerol kinase family enzyme
MHCAAKRRRHREEHQRMGNVEHLKLGRHQNERVAVLLNANAKAVSEGLRRELENFVPAEDLFYSRSFDEARVIARTVLDRGYRTVLTGGGDGTFVGYVNCLFEEAAAAGAHASAARGGALKLAPQAAHALRLPRFGVLKLGTGNALAGYAGASANRVGVVEDILRTRSGECSVSRPLHLLSHEGKRAPFAGVGVDAAVLNDYVGLKNRLRGSKLEFAGVGGLGYFWSVVGKTIPTALSQRRLPEVEIINLGASAQQIGPDGKPLGREIEHGEILYKGPCRLAAAGTVPCYGYGFKIFPHALRSPGRFQLRVTAMSVAKILGNLRTIWKGGTPRTGILDFHCEKVLIRFDREMPVQVGGDAEGYRRELVLEMAERPLELLDFNA